MMQWPCQKLFINIFQLLISTQEPGPFTLVKKPTMPSARPRNRAPNCDWHTSCKISGDPNHRGEPIGSKEIDLVAQNSRRPCRLRHHRPISTAKRRVGKECVSTVRSRRSTSH